MKIVASIDNRDYYDCVQRNGFDPSVVYLRKNNDTPAEQESLRKSIKKIDGFWRPVVFESKQDSGVELTIFIIGFAGNLYPCFGTAFCRKTNKYTTKNIHPLYGNNYELIENYFYELNELETYLKSNLTEKGFEKYKSYFRTNKWRTGIEEILKCNSNKELKNLFSYECPIFVITYDRIIRNGLLKQYKFFKVFDVNRAYQELAMYMSNFAVPFKKEIIISDEMKIATHGFDKFSFRKDKSKKNK